MSKKASRSERQSLASYSIAKGLMILQSLANRGARVSEQRLGPSPHYLSRSSLAISRYYKKMNDVKSIVSVNGFAPEMEALRKAFLMRPGCPQFSTKATSMSHLGSATSVELCKTRKHSLETSRVSEDWLWDQQNTDMSADRRVLAFSKSACELSLRKGRAPQALSPVSSGPLPTQSYPAKRMPWYISVIHDKDRSLLVLGEEVQRLSELEAQVQKKDQELLQLRKEREDLKKHLTRLRRRGLEAPGSSIWMMSEGSVESMESLLAPGGGEGDQVPEAEPKGDGEAGASEDRPGAGEEEALEEETELGEEEGEEEEEEEEVLVAELEEEEQEAAAGGGHSPEDPFERDLVAQLEEFEGTLLQFQSELELTRAKYALSVGAVKSLQRQVDFQESQLRKIDTENGLLLQELRERKQQLAAMSDKFSRLREVKKHQELMGLIEKDNLVLRQHVSELESELGKRDLAISELDAKVRALEAQVTLDQDQLRRWKQLQEDLRGRNETVHQAEQQARVALESAQSRLERLRNRIMQAAFSVSGVKPLSVEISDNYILEALQRIINERSDYYNQLKQKGVRVPPLQQLELPPGKSKKPASK